MGFPLCVCCNKISSIYQVKDKSRNSYFTIRAPAKNTLERLQIRFGTACTCCLGGKGSIPVISPTRFTHIPKGECVHHGTRLTCCACSLSKRPGSLSLFWFYFRRPTRSVNRRGNYKK